MSSRRPRHLLTPVDPAREQPPSRSTPARYASAGRRTLVCLMMAACLPRERLNDSCVWTGDSIAGSPLPSSERREHLIQDIRLAEALGFRYADSVAGRLSSPRHYSLRIACTEASIQQIVQRHSASRAEITALTGVREPWIDAVVVFLPMAVLLLFASRIVVKRVVAGYDAEDRWVARAMLTVLAPIAAAVGVALTQLWAWDVETIRIDDGHLGYRVFQIPAFRHELMFWLLALALFSAVAVPLTLRENQPAKKR
jgi:hypothetical protein